MAAEAMKRHADAKAVMLLLDGEPVTQRCLALTQASLGVVHGFSASNR
jgi:hypothetical protein